MPEAHGPYVPIAYSFTLGFDRFSGHRSNGGLVLFGHGATDSERHPIVPGRVFHVDHRELFHAYVRGDESTAQTTAAVQERIHLWPVRRSDLLHSQHVVVRKHNIPTDI